MTRNRKCVSRGTWVIWHAKIFENDCDQWFHYVDIITHVTTKHECTARVPHPWGFFFCRQRKLRRVKGKTFFVAETQCQVIIYGKGGQLFPWQEQTFNSHGRARSTRRTPRCVTIATYNERNYLPYPIACEQVLQSWKVDAREARERRHESGSAPRGFAARSLARVFARIARRACPQATYSMKLCVVMWVLPCAFSIVCITSFETSPIRNIKKYPYERDARM